MNFTNYSFSGKPLAALAVGCLRFPNREAAADVIRTCVQHQVLYLDASPAYCFQSEEENAETWVGAAIQGIRDRVILSSKSSSGNGGMEIGEYNPRYGMSIDTADQARRAIEQSLRRLQVDRLDCYHLWAISAPVQFDAALKTGGWMDGVLKAKEEGLFAHLGITGHPPPDQIKRWIDSGYFEMITIPFHMMDRSRLEAIHYAREKGVAVLAMNPLAGGLLGSSSMTLAREMADLEVSSAYDLALRYCASFSGVTALSGMASADQARENIASLSKPLWTEEQAEAVRQRFDEILNKAENVCTGCNYCEGCPEDLNIPGILKLRNYYAVFQMETAANEFRSRYRRNSRFQADRCTACAKCESQCPNGLPISQLMVQVMETMGDGVRA